MNESLSILAMQVLNGLAYGMLLFLLAAGLSLIFGNMDILNLAHGSFYMLGAYIALSVAQYLDNFWLALILAPLLVGLISLVLELGLLRISYNRGHLTQVLLTFGLAYVFNDLVRWIWGAAIHTLTPPASISGSLEIMGQTFPRYRVFVVLLGFVIAFLLWFFQEKTRWGAIIRAGVSDKEMVGGLGINIHLVFTLIFALGGVLAGLSGVAAGPILGLYPGMDFETLIFALIVVVVGGLGSFTATFGGAIIIGLADTLGKVWFPEASLFLIFAIMAVVLLVKPQGLFGGRAA
ncbi:MAG: branched-chain amino acid ABC transporter permease [Clostridia bacterium]|nr:branched-chain amino acid ABC transporter permease [Clostridia bacterium]